MTAVLGFESTLRSQRLKRSVIRPSASPLVLTFIGSYVLAMVCCEWLPRKALHPNVCLSAP